MGGSSGGGRDGTAGRGESGGPNTTPKDGEALRLPERGDTLQTSIFSTCKSLEHFAGEGRVYEYFATALGPEGKWAARSDKEWVRLERKSGKIPDRVAIEIDTRALEVGVHDATVEFETANDGEIFSFPVRVEVLEPGTFGAPTLLAGSTAPKVSGVLGADFDRDGDDDVVAASDERLLLFENDGAGQLSETPREVARDVLGTAKLRAADVDGDGDLDLLLIAGFVQLLENRDGTFARPRVVVTASRAITDAMPFDFDADGDADLILTTSEYVWAVRAEDSGTRFSVAQEVDFGYGSNGVLRAADVDADERVDLIVMSAGSAILWYPLRSDGTFGARKLVDGSSYWRSFDAADYDGDGDADLAVVSGTELALLLNQGSGEQWEKRHVTISAGREVRFVDVGAELLAVAVAETTLASTVLPEAELSWVYPAGSKDIRVLETNPFAFASLETADLDGDGSQDLLASSPDAGRLVWYPNIGGGELGGRRDITLNASGMRASVPYDVDGDGDLDLVSTALQAQKLFIHERTAPGVFAPPVLLSEGEVPAFAFEVGDLNGDGLPDLLYSSDVDGKAGLSWHPAKEDGSLGPRTFIELVAPGRHIQTMDANGDGAVDLVFGGQNSADVCENVEPLGSFPCGQYDRLHALGFYAGAWTAADLDGDRVPEFVFAGRGSPSKDMASPYAAVRVSTAEAAGIVLGDLDGDGYDDAVVRYAGELGVGWARRVPGELAFENGRSIVARTEVRSLALGDLDRDGDLDVVIGALHSDDSCDENADPDEPPDVNRGYGLAWYENEGGSFTQHRLFGLGGDTSGITLVDVDDDDDLDIVFATTGTNELRLYLNRTAP